MENPALAILQQLKALPEFLEHDNFLINSNLIEKYNTIKFTEKLNLWKNLTEKILKLTNNKHQELSQILTTTFSELFTISDALLENYDKLETIEILQKENQDLFFQNNELKISLEFLQEESKNMPDKKSLSQKNLKFTNASIIPKEPLSPDPKLENEKKNQESEKKIIPNKLLEFPKQIDPSLLVFKNSKERNEIVSRTQSKKIIAKTKPSNSKELSLKQLKETIEDIYTSKVKFDERCLDNKQPRETMDQYLYTYLNQKYGLKSLINEWSLAILKTVEKYEQSDSEVCLFSRILKHAIDEDYRLVFDKLKDNMKQYLKAKIQIRNPYMREPQISATLKAKINGMIDEDEWATIIVSMFSKEEAEYIIGNIRQFIDEKSQKLIFNGRNKGTGKYDESYIEIQNSILMYDMSAHQALIEPFSRIFQENDYDNNGVISRDEFLSICEKIEISENLIELLEQVDPKATGSICFSNCVNVFSYVMIQNEDMSQESVLHHLYFSSQSSNCIRNLEENQEDIEKV